MAEAPSAVGTEDWKRERFEFLCSVVSFVDKNLLRKEISKCETEDEVQAILESLLLFESQLNVPENRLSLSNIREPPHGDMVVMVDEEGPPAADDDAQVLGSESEDGNGDDDYLDTSNSYCSDDGDYIEAREIDGRNDVDFSDDAETVAIDSEVDNSFESADNESVNLDDAQEDYNTSINEHEYEIVDIEEVENYHTPVVSEDEVAFANVFDLNNSSSRETAEAGMQCIREGTKPDFSDSEVTLEDLYNDARQVESPVLEELVPEITQQTREFLGDIQGAELFMEDDRQTNEVSGHVSEEEPYGLSDTEERPQVQRSDQQLEPEVMEEVERHAVRTDIAEVSDDELLAIDLATAELEQERDSRIAGQLDMIHNIFTGADPDFLQEKIDRCLAMGGDQERFTQYVEELLKISKYPTMKEYTKKQREATGGNAQVDFLDVEDDEQVESLFTIQCTICLEDKALGIETAFCNSAKYEHTYCLLCIKRYVKAQIEESNAVFRCMETGCNGEFSLKVLRKVLDPSVLARVLEQRQHEEIITAGIENLESCPFCNYKVIIQNPQDKVFRCLNPQCMTDSCRLCKEESHLPLRCEEVEKDPQKEARKKLANKMSEAMIRVCPQCGKPFIKFQGCNTVKCICGANICYFCKHLTNSAHHMNSKQCGQTSDENAIHAREVRDAAHEGKLEMDPNIKLVHDPTEGIL